MILKNISLLFTARANKIFYLLRHLSKKFNLNLEYGIHNFSIGTRFTYFGKIVLLGYGDGNSDDFSPAFNRGDLYGYVPADADGHPVRDEYNYGGKIVSDLYFLISFQKQQLYF